MVISVSSRELEDLVVAIDCRLRVLQEDMVRTDDRPMRLALREDLERLELLRDHLRNDTGDSRG
jgi:hypothetical protein